MNENYQSLRGAAYSDNISHQQMVSEKMRAALICDRAEASAIGGGLIGACAPRGTLECASDSLAGGLDELSSAISMLEQRLQPVLQPEAVVSTGNAACGSNPIPPVSPAVGYLHNLRHRIEVLVCRVNAVSVRLDT